MAATLRVIEETPATRPAVPGLSVAAAAIDPEATWRRLEGWASHRWGVRSVTMLVQGPGVWEPRLRPWTLTGVEVFDLGEWAPVEVAAHPLGFDLPCEIPYRFTLSVGDVTAPADVLEAFRRLAEYLAEDSYTVSGASSVNASISDAITVAYQRPSAWIAKALHLSGASDLLRPYRDLGAC